jgi:hypothetical protein
LVDVLGFYSSGYDQNDRNRQVNTVIKYELYVSGTRLYSFGFLYDDEYKSDEEESQQQA